MGSFLTPEDLKNKWSTLARPDILVCPAQREIHFGRFPNPEKKGKEKEKKGKEKN